MELLTVPFLRSSRTLFRAVVAALVAAMGLAGLPQGAAAVLNIHGTTPVGHARGVSPDLSEIWAFFNQPLDPLPESCVRVAGSMSGLHDGTITRADNVIIFQNGAEPFFAGELVTVNYRSDIRAMGSGDLLTGGFGFAFTIASGPSPASWSTPLLGASPTTPRPGGWEKSSSR